MNKIHHTLFLNIIFTYYIDYFIIFYYYDIDIICIISCIKYYYDFKTFKNNVL